MSDSENLELVKRAYAALDADDLPAFLDLCADDIEWVYPPTEEIPYSGRWTGHDGVGRFLDVHDATEEILEWTQSAYIAGDDRVVVLGHYRGRPKPSGREWETDFVDVLAMRDGRIARFEAFFDTAAGAKARAAVPAGA